MTLHFTLDGIQESIFRNTCDRPTRADSERCGLPAQPTHCTPGPKVRQHACDRPKCSEDC